MKLSKKLILSACAFGLAFASFADDFDDFGDFGDSGSYGESEEPKVELGGLVEMNARAYVDHKAGERDEKANLEWDDVGGRTVAVFPTGRVNIGFSNTFSDVEIKLKLDKFSLQEGYYQDILDEFTARAYIGNFQFEAGKMRVVWGKGDKLHVLDNFNANDYTDYIIPDYIDRRIAEPMFRAVYSTNNNIKFEGVYTPFMTADRLASNGMWVPKQSSELTTFIREEIAGNEKTGKKGKLADYITNKDTAKIAYAVLSGMEADLKTYKTIVDTHADLTQKKTDINNLIALKSYADANSLKAYLVYNAQVNPEKPLTSQEEFDAIYNTATQSLPLVEAGLTKLDPLLPNAKVEQATLTEELAQAYMSTGFSSSGEAFEAITAAETAYTLALNNASSFSNDPDSIYPDLYQLKYGQFGFRTTFTLGSVDLGLSYYNGHNKQPSVDARKVAPYLDKVLAGEKITDDDRFVAYDRLQVFGFEAAAVLFGRLNSRLEFAYNMTEDFAGDDPAIHNNSLGWVAGFDLDLPIHNINFNVQTNGKFILKGGEINDSMYKSIDVDADPNDCYTNNKLVVDITDSWSHEKIKLDLKGIWGIERGDLLVMPTMTFMLKDDFALNLSGLLILCKDSESEFDGWQHNSFAQIGVKYQF